MKQIMKKYFRLVLSTVILVGLAALIGIIQVRADDSFIAGDDSEAILQEDSAVELVEDTPEDLPLEEVVQEEIIVPFLEASVATSALPSQTSINAIAGKQYDITLSACNIKNFSEKAITVQYDSAELQLVDLCSTTKEKETVAGGIATTNITVTQAIPGEISFTVDRSIPTGKVWSGVLNTFKFKALQNKSTAIIVSATGMSTDPIPTTIDFTQASYSVTIPASSSATTTVTAQVKDQSGNVMSEYSPTYSITPDYTGISINSSTGVVTVQSNAAAGTVNIVASYGTLTEANATLTLSQEVPIPTSIEFTQASYSVTIPASSSATTTVTAQVKDQSGNVMSEYSPTYSITPDYIGISINSTTGVVTVQSNAVAGTVNIVASYGTLSAQVPLVLEAKVATPTASPVPGTYAATQTVTLSCATSGATIRYTTDDTEPTSSSTIYSAPIQVSTTTTIQAKAFKTGMIDSDAESFTYTISASSEKSYSLVFYLDVWGSLDPCNGYIIDVNSTDTVFINAFVLSSQGNIVTAPEVISIIYTADSGAQNTTGEFTLDDLEIWGWGEETETYVTATATLSSGEILQEQVQVIAMFIQPRR